MIIVKNLLNRIKNLLCRGVLTLVNDEEGVQLVQTSLLADEVRSDIEHPTEYGFTSKAIPGAQTISIFYGGNRDNGSVITVYDQRYRIKNLEDGDVCIYNNEGNTICLKQGGLIEITAPLVRIIGNLEVTGTINATGDISSAANVTDFKRTMDNDRSIYNVHRHGGGDLPFPLQ